MKKGYVIVRFDSYSQSVVPIIQFGIYTTLESVIKALKNLNEDYIKEDIKFFKGVLTVDEIIKEKYIGNNNCSYLTGGELGAVEISIYD